MKKRYILKFYGEKTLHFGNPKQKTLHFLYFWVFLDISGYFWIFLGISGMSGMSGMSGHVGNAGDAGNSGHPGNFGDPGDPLHSGGTFHMRGSQFVGRIPNPPFAPC